MSPDYVNFMNIVSIFYENSWNKLLFTISVIFAVIGVIIPIAIQVYQQKQFRDATKDSSEKVDQALLKLKQDVLQELEVAEKRLEEKLEIKYNERYKKIELENKRFNAYAFHLQGIISQKEGKAGDALGSYSTSISGYHAVGDHSNLQTIFENITTIYDGIDSGAPLKSDCFSA